MPDQSARDGTETVQERAAELVGDRFAGALADAGLLREVCTKTHWPEMIDEADYPTLDPEDDGTDGDGYSASEIAAAIMSPSTAEAELASLRTKIEAAVMLSKGVCGHSMMRPDCFSCGTGHVARVVLAALGSAGDVEGGEGQ